MVDDEELDLELGVKLAVLDKYMSRCSNVKREQVKMSSGKNECGRKE